MIDPRSESLAEAMTGSVGGAIFSPTKAYRYLLWRTWNDGPVMPGEWPRMVAFIGLNPSTADEVKNDPTVSRCIRMAREWGFEGMFMLNIFALRSTDPTALRNKNVVPVGAMNDVWIQRTAADSEKIVVCWGNYGLYRRRQERVLELLEGRKLWCLGVNKTGTPKHPLYLPKTTELRIFR